MLRKNIEKKNKQKRVIRFWVLLLGLLIFCSLSLKAYLGLKNSFFLVLSRGNFLIKDVAGSEFLVSLEGKEAIVLELPEGIVSVQKSNFIPLFGDFKIPRTVFIVPGKEKSFILNIFWEAFWKRTTTSLNRYDLAILFFRSAVLDPGKVSWGGFRSDQGELFKDVLLREEALPVAVMNATDHSGFAQKTADLIRNAGGRVVRITDQEEKKNDCVIISHGNKEENYTLRWLVKVFGCRVEKSSGTEGRVEVTLVLGEDYWKKVAP